VKTFDKTYVYAALLLDLVMFVKIVADNI